MKINIYCKSQERFLSDYELLNCFIQYETFLRVFEIDLVTGEILLGRDSTLHGTIWEGTTDLEVCVDSHSSQDWCSGCLKKMMKGLED